MQFEDGTVFVLSSTDNKFYPLDAMRVEFAITLMNRGEFVGMDLVIGVCQHMILHG